MSPKTEQNENPSLRLISVTILETWCAQLCGREKLGYIQQTAISFWYLIFWAFNLPALQKCSLLKVTTIVLLV